MNKFNRCFTPTSLWKALQESGTGDYNIIVSNDNIKIKQK